MRLRDPWLLPYGFYFTGNTSILFDRRYKPLVMLAGRWPDCDRTRAVRCNREWRIDFDAQAWFYDDGCSPTYNLKKRAELKRLVMSIPELTAEIERRSGKKVAA